LGVITGSTNPVTFATNMVNRMMTAVDTVLSANPPPLGMIVAGLPDMTLVPAAQTYLPFIGPAEKRLVINTIDLINSMIKSETLARDLVFIDTAQALRDLNAMPPVVGGVPIQMVGSSSNPSYFFQDGLHPAAV